MTTMTCPKYLKWNFQGLPRNNGSNAVMSKDNLLSLKYSLANHYPVNSLTTTY